jgi:LmbE family N-acetylglucosaminyl deacetylase
MGSGLEYINTPMPEEKGPKRALVVAAHPDDSEFGVGGTAAKWSKEGWEFYYLICTDGSKGSEDPEMTPEKLVPLRREEQRGAANVLGVKEVFFLDHVDGELKYTPDLMREVVRHIRQLKPHAVFTHDPNQIVRNLFINHPDHRCAGEVAIDAVYPIARNRPSFPELLKEGLEPYSVKEIYLWTASDTTFEVDITETIDTKFEALRQHASQRGDMEESAPRLRQFWSGPDGKYLERFRQIVLPF